jgi:7-cyano-7-deazaguanine synthase
MGLSGGMDSATLLGILLEQGYEVHCCTFYYGSKHNKYENRAAEELIDYYLYKGFPVVGHPFDLSKVFADYTSDLLLTGGAIPEGHYTDATMKKTVVPGRNLIFASIMAGLAESIEAEMVALGVHAGDHTIYPDCRPDFIHALLLTISYATDSKVSVYTPFLNIDKTEVLRKGINLKLPVPYHLTRSCYKDQQVACGRCGTCVERIESFTNLGITDPIPYESI